MSAVDVDSDMIMTEFMELLNSGLENPEGMDGVCRIDMGKPYGVNSVTINISSSGIEVSRNSTSAFDARICLPMAALERILIEKDHLDFRDPSFLSTVELHGDKAIIYYVAQSLLRPNPWSESKMDSLTKRNCIGYQIEEVKRLASPTEEEILELISCGEPFIISPQVSERDLNSWTLERIKDLFSDESLIVPVSSDIRNVGQFIDFLLEHMGAVGYSPKSLTKKYTEGCALPVGMRNHFLPHFFSLENYYEPQMWLGCVPVEVPATSLHRDLDNAFLFQIIGRKKIILFAPDQAPYLRPKKTWNNFQPCWVKPSSPDFDKYPEFQHARALEVVLNPGETFVQPAGWFHEVYCLDSPTFSVSYFKKD